jgi:glycosyltransferase involved in cell wall biosynthesis
MSTPMVTVLMPVYNSERFLKQAVQSVLSQTFTDFELLIINDGSTDASVSIIQSFDDPRIRLIHNERNIGVIGTLNKGVALANGKYIARMDADDYSLPIRLEKQVRYLERNPEVAVVATHIIQINAGDEELGHWDDDIQNTKPYQIFKTLAKTNCIAHPTVMMRTDILRSYGYHEQQKGSEDWDLWMRLVSDGHRIDKLTEFLLRYRLHTASVTAIHNRGLNIEKKINRVRVTFLKERLKKFRLKKFELLVVVAILRTSARDLKINKLPLWLRFWKRLLTISPVRAYQQFSLLKKVTTQTENSNGIFLFFPYTHVGGAEKVHALISETVKDQQPWIFFTGFSANKKFLPLFENSGALLDVALGINHPFYIKRSKNLIIAAIEKVKHPVVFGCNNVFFYELIPHLSDKVKIIDLMHDFRFDGEQDVFKSYLPAFMRCNQRVFISERAIEQTKKFYKAQSVESAYADRLVYISNYVDIPTRLTRKEKKDGDPLSIIYVGRGTAEKRAYLVSEIARICFEKKLPVQFQIIGDIEQPADLKNNTAVTFTGELTDTDALKTIYSTADILLITSEREGFPMAMMEGMAYGVIPVSTPVGDIPKHIRNGETGYLTTGIDPKTIPNEMAGYISMLIDQKEKRALLSEQVYEYVKMNFSKEKFTKAYRRLLIDKG